MEHLVAELNVIMPYRQIQHIASEKIKFYTVDGNCVNPT